jgi:plasmid stabilization system protein ParE
MRVRWTTRGRRERLEAIRFLEEQRPGLGGDFDRQTNRVVDLIAEFPRAFPLCPGIDDGEVRRGIIRNFSLWVVYEIYPSNGDIVILTLWHHRRLWTADVKE